MKAPFDPIRRLAPTTLAASLLLTAVPSALLSSAAAQEDPADVDWRLPYRSPETKIAPPDGLFEVLRRLQTIYNQAPESGQLSVRGRDAVESNEWSAAMADLDRLELQPPYLSLIIRDSNIPNDRRTAFFGSFLIELDDMVRTFIEHIPGEPSRSIREEAYLRAVRWMAHHDSPGYERSGEEIAEAEATLHARQRRDRLDLTPFFAVLDLEEEIDRAQGLWFLTQISRIHPYYGEKTMEGAYRRLIELADDPSERVRAQLRELVIWADPDQDRREAGLDEDADIRERLEAIRYEMFPPIRRVSAGVFELYPHADRDEILEVGQRWLEGGGFGENVSGRDSRGVVYYGLRLPELPEPLNRLGIPSGVVLVAISGSVVRRPSDVAELLEIHARPGGAFFLEYVDGQGKRRAVQYRIMREY